MESPFDIAADLDTPVSAYMKLRPFEPRFLLESVESGERLARYSFIGLGAAITIELSAHALTLNGTNYDLSFGKIVDALAKRAQLSSANDSVREDN